MKKLTILAALFAVSAHAQADGALLGHVEGRIQSGVEACGLNYVSGQDPGLAYQIRARNVDAVVVKTLPDGDLVPGVLVDHDINGRDHVLTYAKTNGGHIMSLRRDYDMNDLAVDVATEGRVAYSRSYWRGRILETRYYVKAPRGGQYEVSKDEFLLYLDRAVADDFAAMVCDEARR